VTASNRREAICEASTALLARDGARGLTHHAVDRRLGLPLGSTSYYFRTRHALLEATARWIALQSRASLNLVLSIGAQTGRPGPRQAAEVIGAQVAELLTARRDQALARTALLGERRLPADLRRDLSLCLFSAELAEGLLAALGASEPREGARDLITFLEGLVAEELWTGPDDPDAPGPDPAALAARLERHLERLLRPGPEGSGA